MNIKQLLKKGLMVGICSTFIFSAVASAEAAETQDETQISTFATTSGQNVINTGKKYLGTKYVFGSASGNTRTFDCSSFTQYIFKRNGVKLPRSSRQQSKVGHAVSRANLKTGDLVFFSTKGKGVDHVAVYAGNGRILHTYGEPGVTFSNLNSGQWNRTYVGARRVL